MFVVVCLFLIFRPPPPLFFNVFFLFFKVSYYAKQFLGGLHLFENIVFKESTLQYLEKIQVQIIVFNIKSCGENFYDLQLKP